MADLAALERRLAPPEPQRPAPRPGEPQRRRNAVARFEQERARSLADPTTSALKMMRLTADGGRGMSQASLAILAGCSRDAVSRAERGDPRTSAATLRRLASALGVSVASLRP